MRLIYEGSLPSIMASSWKSWITNAESEKKKQFLWKEVLQEAVTDALYTHRTNENVEDEVLQKSGEHEIPLSTVIRRKQQWFGHLTWPSKLLNLANTIVLGRGFWDKRKGKSQVMLLWNVGNWKKYVTWKRHKISHWPVKMEESTWFLQLTGDEIVTMMIFSN